MVVDFEVRKLQSMGGADHHGFVAGFDDAALDQFGEDCQGDSGMGAGEHTGQIRMGCCCGEFIFRGLFDDAVGFDDRFNRLVIADGITNANGVGEGILGCDRDFFLESIFEGFIEGVGLGGLSCDEARHAGNQAQVHHQPESLVEGADVAEVADGDDDPIGDFPVKLPQDFDAYGFLAFDP